VYYHEAAAAEVTGLRVGNGEHEGDGDGRVDGIAAGPQDLDTDLGGEAVDGGDHRLAAVGRRLGQRSGRGRRADYCDDGYNAGEQSA